uniref:Uncharacterized protein n=1 Tax=Triticum urartu TaxID=4572 RepID=A0A8R7V5S2_TRIUA
METAYHHRADQKSSSMLKTCWVAAPPLRLDMTDAFWYSPTRFSKKLVLPCSEMSSIQSNGLVALYSFLQPSAMSRRSATNSMYWLMRSPFMPTSAQGSASQTNSLSMSTASDTISKTRDSSSLPRRMS